MCAHAGPLPSCPTLHAVACITSWHGMARHGKASLCPACLSQELKMRADDLLVPCCLVWHPPHVDPILIVSLAPPCSAAAAAAGTGEAVAGPSPARPAGGVRQLFGAYQALNSSLVSTQCTLARGVHHGRHAALLSTFPYLFFPKDEWCMSLCPPPERRGTVVLVHERQEPKPPLASSQATDFQDQPSL